jgi:hypothetical protein
MISILLIDKVMANQRISYLVMMNFLNWNIHLANLNEIQRRKHSVMIQKLRLINLVI